MALEKLGLAERLGHCKLATFNRKLKKYHHGIDQCNLGAKDTFIDNEGT
jgi:hypothetical protein